MDRSHEHRLIIASYLKFVDFLAHVYGKHCEIVLHALNGDAFEIAAIKNGYVSQRKVGDLTSALGKKVNAEMAKDHDFDVNKCEVTATGKPTRSHTFFIKDSQQTLIGLLCINMDMSLPLDAKKYFDDLLRGFENGAQLAAESPTDRSIHDLTTTMIKEVIAESGIPVSRMTPDERIGILKNLKEKEIFRTKGAAREVSRHLGISEATIYRYLREID